jgi:hypothetical protein
LIVAALLLPHLFRVREHVPRLVQRLAGKNKIIPLPSRNYTGAGEGEEEEVVVVVTVVVY